MLNLTTSGSEIRVTSSAAATLDIHASWADLVSGAVTIGQTDTAMVSATTTAVVTGPGSGVRNVKTLFIRNKGAVPATVTVAHYNGTTAFEIYSAFVGAGGQLHYSEGTGFFASNTAMQAGVHGAAARGSGAFILPTLNATALGTAAGAANRFEALPYIPTHNQTINELALEVTTLLAASQFYLAVYADNGSAAPGTLIVGTSVLDSASTGYKTGSVANTTLGAGTLYWLVTLISGTQTFRAVAIAGAYAFSAPAAAATAAFTVQRGTSTFGSGLPGTAPACTPTNAAIPAVRLRLA